MKIEPRTTHVLVKPKKLDDKRGNIFIPASALQREQKAVTEGEVIAIGPDAWADYNDEGSKVGDFVVYAQYSGHILTDSKTKEEFALIYDTDIKATVGRTEEDEDGKQD